MAEKLMIIGTGANAKHVYSLIKNYDLFEVIGFAVNREYLTNEIFEGLPVYAIEELENVIDKNEVKLFVALLWNRLNADRKKLYTELKAQGYKFANVISPRASIRGKIVGDNCWIHDFVVIQNDAVIHSNIAIMAYSLIGDMCYLSGKVPLINGWRVVYYSLPVSSISSSVVLGKIDNDYFSISTSTLENHSVIELKRMDNSLMGSGEISFTLIYKYK